MRSSKKILVDRSVHPDTKESDDEERGWEDWRVWRVRMTWVPLLAPIQWLLAVHDYSSRGICHPFWPQ